MAHKATAMALTLALVSSPALAGASDDKADRRTVAAETKYCIKIAAGTGSKIDRQQCRTKEDWARAGVDVGKLQKK